MARLLGAGVRFDLPRLGNCLGMELALIPPGAFLMGSPPDEAGRGKDAQQHEVEITRAFGLGVHPVTVGQFRAFAQATGYRQGRWQDPCFSQDDRHPVVNVSWDHAQAFCTWLTQLARVIRGGSWGNHGRSCRSANRDAFVPTNRLNYLGFRVALVWSGG
jgi:formylglycine-generating enzyme required for sulfatase activity